MATSSSAIDPSTPTERTTSNLKLIGALSYTEFECLPYQPTRNVPDPSYAILEFSSPEGCVKPPHADSKGSLAKLYQACQSAFPGSPDILAFEYVSTDTTGTKAKQCILTVTRPNGASRTYKSDVDMSHKKDAKVQVCDRAVASQAVEFILQGGAELPNVTRLASEQPVSECLPESVHEIESLCTRRNMRIQWYIFMESKGQEQKYGAALRVSWSATSFKDYSSLPAFDTEADAKSECASVALDGGFREIHGAPSDFRYPAPVTSILPLQVYFQSLPRPFPEPECEKSLAADVAISVWINTTIQSAKGILQSSFFPFTANGLQGCVLLAYRPGKETRAYIAEGRFSKRTDAKGAACFLAMASGLGQWVRDLKSSVAASAKHVSPEMRKQSQSLAQSLKQDCSQLSLQKPSIQYIRDDSTSLFSATLTVYLADTDTRTFSVPSEYATKEDAQAAVYKQVATDDTLQIVAQRLGPKRKQSYEPEAGEVVERPKKRKKHAKPAATEVLAPLRFSAASGSELPMRPVSSESFPREITGFPSQLPPNHAYYPVSQMEYALFPPLSHLSPARPPSQMDYALFPRDPHRSPSYTNSQMYPQPPQYPPRGCR